MATQVQSWRAEDGSLHHDERSAVDRDIRVAVGKLFPAPVTDQTFDDMVREIIAHREPLMKALSAYHRLHPQASAPEKAPPPAAEKGPMNSGEGTQEGVPGVTAQATEDELTPHMRGCKARASGFFRHCSCGAFSTAQIEEYRRQSDEAFEGNRDG